MRQIYTSPRAENIDRVIALMHASGIAASVANRSRYDHSSWKRHSYLQRQERREEWEQVWIVHPDDYKNARVLLAELGIEPVVVHGEELALARDTSPVTRRRHIVARARRIVLLVLLATCALVMLRYMHIL